MAAIKFVSEKLFKVTLFKADVIDKRDISNISIALGMLDFDNWIPYDRENNPLPVKQKLLAYQYDAFTHITQAMESTMWAK